MKKFAYAIGDLHGCYQLLILAWNKIQQDVQKRGLTKDDYVIVTLGDYTDRGPESKQVIDFLMQKQAEGEPLVCLAGNHEYILLNCYDWDTFDPLPAPMIYPSLRSFLRNGGVETLASYGYRYKGDWNADLTVIPKEHLKWLRSLPLFYETENYFFVHAGVKPDRSLDEQDPNDMIWIRHEFFLAADAHFPFDWGKHIVHGHTPTVRYTTELKHNRTNLDTGSVWSGEQAIGVFDLSVQHGPVEVLMVEEFRPRKEDEVDIDDDDALLAWLNAHDQTSFYIEKPRRKQRRKLKWQ